MDEPVAFFETEDIVVTVETVLGGACERQSRRALSAIP